MDKKTLLVSIVTSAVIALGIGFTMIPNDGTPGMPGTPGTPGSSVLGGGVSFQTGSNYLCPGGTCLYAYHQDMTTATNTICAAKSPSATSTLLRAYSSITEGTTTASTLVWGYGNHSNATTTVINSTGLAANQKSFTGMASGTLMIPNTWVTLSQQGGVGTMSNTGSCNITFESTQQ